MKIILLLGNHDIQYINNNIRHRCSGYINDKFISLNSFFNEYKRVAYSVPIKSNSYIVWYNKPLK